MVLRKVTPTHGHALYGPCGPTEEKYGDLKRVVGDRYDDDLHYCQRWHLPTAGSPSATRFVREIVCTLALGVAERRTVPDTS